MVNYTSPLTPSSGAGEKAPSEKVKPLAPPPNDSFRKSLHEKKSKEDKKEGFQGEKQAPASLFQLSQNQPKSSSEALAQPNTSSQTESESPISTGLSSHAYAEPAKTPSPTQTSATTKKPPISATAKPSVAVQASATSTPSSSGAQSPSPAAKPSVAVQPSTSSTVASSTNSTVPSASSGPKIPSSAAKPSVAVQSNASSTTASSSTSTVPSASSGPKIPSSAAKASAAVQPSGTSTPSSTSSGTKTPSPTAKPSAAVQPSSTSTTPSTSSGPKIPSSAAKASATVQPSGASTPSSTSSGTKTPSPTAKPSATVQPSAGSTDFSKTPSNSSASFDTKAASSESPSRPGSISSAATSSKSQSSTNVKSPPVEKSEKDKTAARAEESDNLNLDELLSKILESPSTLDASPQLTASSLKEALGKDALLQNSKGELADLVVSGAEGEGEIILTSDQVTNQELPVAEEGSSPFSAQAVKDKTKTKHEPTLEAQQQAALQAGSSSAPLPLPADAPAIQAPPPAAQSTLNDIASQIVSTIQVMQKGDETKTIVTLKNPPLLEGATITLTSSDHAKREFNISFANLSPDAKLFLDQKLNENGLRGALENKNITVHMISTSTEPESLRSRGESTQGFRERGEQQGKQEGGEQQKQRKQPMQPDEEEEG